MIHVYIRSCIHFCSGRLQTDQQNDIIHMIGSHRLLGWWCGILCTAPNLCKLNFLVFQQQTIKCLMCRNGIAEWRNSHSRLEIDYCCETGNCILDILSAFKWQHFDIQLQRDNSVDKTLAQHAACASTANIVIITITRSDDAAASIDVFISHTFCCEQCVCFHDWNQKCANGQYKCENLSNSFLVSWSNRVLASDVQLGKRMSRRRKTTALKKKLATSAW